MILYHGTGSIFDRFRPNAFFTESVSIAATYAGMRSYVQRDSTVRVLACRVDLGRCCTITVEGIVEWLNAGRSDRFYKVGWGKPLNWEGHEIPWSDVDTAVFSMISAGGYDSGKVVGIMDMGPESNCIQDQYVVANPASVRILHEERGVFVHGYHDEDQKWVPGYWHWSDCMEMAA